jgi:DNA polymerase III epsilon subunit-like protein
MILHAFPKSFTDAWGGTPLPESYVAIDLETTGLSTKKDYPWELGYVLTKDRQATKRGSAVLNLFKLVDEHWLREKWAYTSEQMERRGIHRRNVDALLVDACPRATLTNYLDFLEQAVRHGYFIAGHNVLRYDLPMLRYTASRVLNRELAIPDAQVLDTLALEQANCSLGKRGVEPTSGETFATWQLRVLSNCREKAALSKECAERHGLFRPDERIKSHTALYDCLLVHRLIEAYRKQADAAEVKQERLNVPFAQEDPWRSNPERSGRSTTLNSFRRQRRI